MSDSAFAAVVAVALAVAGAAVGLVTKGSSGRDSCTGCLAQCHRLRAFDPATAPESSTDACYCASHTYQAEAVVVVAVYYAPAAPVDASTPSDSRRAPVSPS